MKTLEVEYKVYYHHHTRIDEFKRSFTVDDVKDIQSHAEKHARNTSVLLGLVMSRVDIVSYKGV